MNPQANILDNKGLIDRNIGRPRCASIASINRRESVVPSREAATQCSRGRQPTVRIRAEIPISPSPSINLPQAAKRRHNVAVGVSPRYATAPNQHLPKAAQRRHSAPRAQPRFLTTKLPNNDFCHQYTDAANFVKSTLIFF
jgi:hypothetical protein